MKSKKCFLEIKEMEIIRVNKMNYDRSSVITCTEIKNIKLFWKNMESIYVNNHLTCIQVYTPKHDTVASLGHKCISVLQVNSFVLEKWTNYTRLVSPKQPKILNHSCLWLYWRLNFPQKVTNHCNSCMMH